MAVLLDSNAPHICRDDFDKEAIAFLEKYYPEALQSPMAVPILEIARTVLESSIEQVLVTAINQALCDKDSFLSTLQDNIATIITHESDQALADIDKRLEELQTELLKLATSNADYDKVGDEIHRLRDQKQKLQLENVNREELKKRIADMSAFLTEQPTALIEYDEQLVRRLIEKVTIYEEKFTVEFKSGVTVDVNE